MSEMHEKNPGLIEQRGLITVGVVLIATIALGAGLAVLQSVALPFVVAVLLTYIVSPVVNFIEVRLRLPRWLGVVFALFVTTGLFAGVVILIVHSVTSLQGNADLYVNRLGVFSTNIIIWLQGLGLDIDPASVNEEIAALPFAEMATSALGSVADILSKAALTLLFFIFIIISRSPWDVQSGIWVQINDSINRYLRVKLLTSVLIGVATTSILFAFGIDLAMVFGIVALLLNFIPTIGSVIGIIATLPLIFVSLSPITGLAAVGCLVLSQNVIGNGIEPKLMGRGLDLHPATILLGLGIWGMIWGVVGMLLSAPLMSIIKILMHRYDTTRPFAELLAGRIGSEANQ